MKKSEFLDNLQKAKPINESASVASVLGDPGSPDYGGFIGPLSGINKKKLYSRLFHTWKDGSVKNGAGVGRLAQPPQGYVKEHIYSVEGKMVTEGDLQDWFGADLKQKPSFNGGKLVAIEPKCLAFPYCSQGAIDKPIKLIGESKDTMCEDCYGYCSHIAEEVGKKPEEIAKIIREKYLYETIDEMSTNNQIIISFEEVEYQGRYFNFDASVMYEISYDTPADRHPDDPSTQQEEYVDYRVYDIKDIQVYNENTNEYEPISDEESSESLASGLKDLIRTNSNYDEYIKDQINDNLNEDLNKDIIVNSLDESIELKYNKKEKINENIKINEMTPELAKECMNKMMANESLSECMYETLVSEGFLPETIEEGDTYESHCKMMMEDAEICMEMVKACHMNETSECSKNVSSFISECMGDNMMENEPASGFANKYAKIQASIEKIGARETGIKLVNMFISRMLPGMGTSDLADTATFANGLDTIEEYLEDGNYQEAIEEAKNTAEAMLEDEGMGMDMFGEGWMVESEGINPAIYDQLKDCIEKGHSYEEAKKHVAAAVDGWDLSMEDYNEAKKKFGKHERDGVELEEKWMEEGELEEGGEGGRYMFFANLEQIKHQAEELLALDHNKIEDTLNNGHDWAADHVSTAKETLDHVFDFMVNEKEPESKGEGELNESEYPNPSSEDMTGHAIDMLAKAQSLISDIFNESTPEWIGIEATKIYESIGDLMKKIQEQSGNSESINEYDDETDVEDDIDVDSDNTGQYEKLMRIFTKDMNVVEKATTTVASILSSEDVKAKFTEYFGQFEADKNVTADDFINFLSKGDDENYVDYCLRLFTKSEYQSIFYKLVSPTKREFLRKSRLILDDSMMDALDTIANLESSVMKKAKWFKDYEIRRGEKPTKYNDDKEDDFSDEKEPTMADLKNIEKMGNLETDDDEDFLEESELPKFEPKKGKNVDSENKKSSETENDDAIKGAEGTQETTEEKVDNLKNQKFSPNMETEMNKETKDISLGYKNALNLDYATEPSDAYKDRVEMEVKTGHSRKRDTELGDEANIDNESKAGEKIWTSSKENQANAEYDWAPNPIATAEQGYQKTSVSGKINNPSKGNKVNEDVVSLEIQKMMKMVSYDQKIINEEKDTKKIDENEILFKSVSKKKLL